MPSAEGEHKKCPHLNAMRAKTQKTLEEQQKVSRSVTSLLTQKPQLASCHTSKKIYSLFGRALYYPPCITLEYLTLISSCTPFTSPIHTHWPLCSCQAHHTLTYTTPYLDISVSYRCLHGLHSLPLQVSAEMLSPQKGLP